MEVCGDAKASSSVAQGSAARFKAEIDEALLNELNKGKLVELNSELLSWEPSHIQSWLVIISPS